MQAEGLAGRVAALQGQLAKLEGDDLLAVLESASLCTSLAAVLSQPLCAGPPSVSPAAAASAGSCRPAAPGAASSTAPAEAQAQAPLLLGAP